MNLNDPFNRLSRQQQSDYIAFRQSLRESSIRDPIEVNALLKSTWKRSGIAAGLLAVSALIGSLLLPESAIVIITFTGLALLWLLTTTFKGQRFIRRYIKEEFKD